MFETPIYVAIELGIDYIRWGVKLRDRKIINTIQLSDNVLSNIPVGERSAMLVREALTWIRDHERFTLPEICVVAVPYLTCLEKAKVEHAVQELGIRFVRILKRISAFAFMMNNWMTDDYENILLVDHNRLSCETAIVQIGFGVVEMMGIVQRQFSSEVPESTELLRKDILKAIDSGKVKQISKAFVSDELPAEYRNMLKEYFHLESIRMPADCILQGAMIHCGILSGHIRDVLLLDATDYEIDVNQFVLFEENTTFPASNTIEINYQTSRPDHCVDMYIKKNNMVSDSPQHIKLNVESLIASAYNEQAFQVTGHIDNEEKIGLTIKNIQTGKEIAFSWETISKTLRCLNEHISTNQDIPTKKKTPPQPKANKQDSAIHVPFLNTLRQIIDFTEKQAQNVPDVIEFICPLPLMRQLREEIPGNNREILWRYTDLTEHAGIMSSSINWNESTGRVKIHVLKYYPGFLILKMVGKGKEHLLNEKDRQTLTVARELLKGIKANHSGDLVMSISKEIGRRTVYTIDETTFDDDCAYGPLLNGKANCDGYADAFYLCAGLAGLIVRYQHGCSNMREHKNAEYKDSSHLWNLVYLNGQWSMLDVTWDKNSKGTPVEYSHCMIGRDRAEKIYKWNHDMSPALMERTDVQRAPSMHEYVCRNLKEAENAAKLAVRENHKVFYIYMERQGILDNKDELVRLFRNTSYHGTFTYWMLEELNGWKVMLESIS